jgi:hypothetical protein
MDRNLIIRIVLSFIIAVAVLYFGRGKPSVPAGGETKVTEPNDATPVHERVRRPVDPFRDLPDALAEAAHIGPTGHENNCFSRAYTLLDFQLGMPVGSTARDLPPVASRKLREPGTSSRDRAIAFLIARKFKEAEAAALQARDEARQKGGEGTHDVVIALELAGLAAEKLWRGGRLSYPKAFEHYQAAAALTSKDRDFLDWVRVQNHIGRVLERLDRTRDAETLLVAALKAAESSKPPLTEHELLQRTRCLLAMMQLILKKYPESEKTCRAVLQVNERVLGREHPVTLENRDALSKAILWIGDRDAEGDRIHDEVYETRKRVLGPDHSDTLLSRMGEATKFRRLGRNEEAAAEYRAVAEARDRTVGPLEPESRFAWSKLSNFYYNDDKFAECEAIERAQLELQEKGLGFQNRDSLNSCYMLMRALQQQEKLEEARALARRAAITAKQSLQSDPTLRSKILELAEELDIPIN